MCIADHLPVTTTFDRSPGLYIHDIEPTYKDHLRIKTTVCWSQGWSLYTSIIVVKSHPTAKSLSGGQMVRAPGIVTYMHP